MVGPDKSSLQQVALPGLFALLAALLALILTGHSTAAPLDYDAAFQWTYAIRKEFHFDFLGYFHHQLLPVLYYIVYLPFSGLETPFVGIRLAIALFYSLFAVAAWTFNRSLFAGTPERIFGTLLLLLHPPILNHVRSFEDNLVGYPPILAALAFAIRYLRETDTASVSLQRCRLIAAASLAAVSFLLGFAFAVWAAGIAGAVVLVHLRVSPMRGLRAASFYSIVFLALIALPLLLKDAILKEPLLTGLLRSVQNPYKAYEGMIPFASGVAGLKNLRLSFFMGLTGLDPFSSTLMDLVVVLAALGAGAALFKIARRGTDGERALAALGMFAAIVYGYQNYSFLDVAVFERTDWIGTWCLLLLGAYCGRRPLEKRLALVLFAIMACVPAFGYGLTQSSRPPYWPEIIATVQSGRTLVYDEQEYTSWGEVGSHELAGLRNCRVLAGSPKPFIPSGCKPLVSEAEVTDLKRKIGEAPGQYLVSDSAAFRLGLRELRVDCNSFVAATLRCLGKKGLASQDMATRFGIALSLACASNPAALECLKSSREACEPLVQCTVKTLGNAARF